MSDMSQSNDTMKEEFHGHHLPANDHDNPQNWPLLRKIYVSVCATAFAFAVAFGLTGYTIALAGVIADFDVSMTLAIAPFSLYLVGIAFAPIYTPHLSERFGRVPIYFFSLLACALFTVGAGFSKSFASLAVCRFFAGFSGGPCMVLIEGTFADVWCAEFTLAYYSCLTLASYLGAACGPIVLGYIVTATSWQWTQYVSLMVALAALLLGAGMPETYAREIIRARARRAGVSHNLEPAESGTTFASMAKITVVTPLVMLFSEPIAALSTLYVSFLFGTTFQWFITVPAVLGLVYDFKPAQAGLAFISAIVGVLMAAASSAVIERIVKRREIEYRLIPAMFGGVLMTASFFWIGWTASPTIHWAAPVVGTLVYVWGSAMILISYISYLFDAYPPAGTLSALTIAASLRLLVAAAIPLCIIQMITNLGGGWTFSAFGFISAGLLPITLGLHRFGARLRMRSKYGGHRMMQGESMM